jgi:hypothetical protein
MNIKKLMRGGLIAASLSVFAMPALPSTLTSALTLSFNNSTSSATLNSSGQITAYTAVLTGISSTDGYNSASLGTLNDTITWTASGSNDVFTITAGSNSGFTGITSGTLLQFTTGPTTGGSSASATYGAVTAFTSLNATFGNAVFDGATLTALTDSGIIKDSPTYSNTLGLSGTVTTPEPASFLMFGAGLICIGLISRRRIAGRQNV